VGAAEQQHRPRSIELRLLVVGLLLVVAALLLFWFGFRVLPTPAPVPPPSPPAPPGPVVVDTGWHMGLDSYDDTYFIPLRYDRMNEVQQDDANRFGRRNPNGGYDPEEQHQ